MIKSFHHRQPFNHSGDVYADSVTRTMKGQSLSMWDMFTRETLQNSWDARDRQSHLDGVSFGLDRVVLSPTQTALLKESVLGSDFTGLPDLQTLFNQEQVDLLLVSDSGTRGLGGPSNPTHAYDGRDDFVSFVRNIGRSDSKELAGGTYGFGKGVFFIVSQVNTVLVYTRSHDEFGNRVNRFISMANDNDFFENGTKYTGRHWWGVYTKGQAAGNVTEYAEPFVGEDADYLASVLGMDKYFTEERPTGTCIAVVAPDMTNDETGEDDHKQVMTRIAQSLTRWAWPHMLGLHHNMDPIHFSVSDENQPVLVPDPSEDPALRYFAQAYRRALERDALVPNQWSSSPIARLAELWTSQPQKKCLGVLSVSSLHEPISEVSTVIGLDVEAHIATIRNPRMVVEYYRGPVNTSGIPYCGVFLADEEADLVFARSEPAAHHQWNHQTVQHDAALLEQFWGRKSRNNPVKILFDRMRSLLKDGGHGKTTVGDTRHFQSLTQLSSSLGNFIAGAVGGKDSRVKPVKKARRPSRPVPKNRPVWKTEFEGIRTSEDGQTAARFDVSVTVPQKLLPLKAEAVPFVVKDSGLLLEKEAEKLGQAFPRVIGWSSNEQTRPDPYRFSARTPAVFILQSPVTNLKIDVAQISQAAIGLKLIFPDPVGNPDNSVEEADNGSEENL